ncbi:MAG: DNA-protecting protein DprA [Proteobacteria bacterium]|nr:DNA-protecting protein DprA [Pseudomonadota bacterium]MBS0574386.1 DNA-protecting protein DprA [Pseudomonadota bacterium]
MRRRHEGQGLFSYPTPFTPPTTEDDRLSWLRLIRSRRVGVATFYRLLGEHGSAGAALAALPDLARAAGVEGYECCPEGVALAELRAARKAGARMICRGETGYPAGLALISDPPPVLWAIGDAGLLARPMVALVGARNASSLGLRMARRLAEGLAGAGVTVVSGLARGIDTAAHQAALAGGTVAVLAGGADVVYPAENAALAADIALRGLCLSEQPLGLVAQARHFPLRNRIIAGLSRAVVVVEAAAQSGSLITARQALEQGREVLAVPGHPFDGRASGCNMLIRDGAALVRGPDDVLAALEIAAPAAPAGNPPAQAAGVRPAVGRTAAAAPEASIAEAPPPSRQDQAGLHRQILDRLGPSPVAEDQLLRDLSLSPATAAPELLTLELDGLIRRAPGGLLSRA